MNHNLITILVIGMVTVLLASWMLLSSNDSYDSHYDEHGHGDHEEDIAKGPHGGRLLI
jgi:hypothetical protein